MGRGRPAKDSGGGTKAKAATEKAPRTTRGLRKSYVEDDGSEPEEFKEDRATSPEPQADDSGSEYAGESSGSEYGKKKKGKVSPKKAPAKRGRKPAGKAQLSPKKPGRPGRKPKAAASSNGKRKRAAESSEDEEEEKISSEEVSEDEASGSGDTSGSEYGKKKTNKKLKKEKPPTRSQPKRQAATSPKKRGRKPKETTNGNKKAKLSEEVEKSEEEDMEVEEPEKKKSEDEGGASGEDEVKEPGTVVEKKSAKVEEKTEDKVDKSDGPDSPKSEEEEKSGSGGEEEEKTEKTSKEKPSATSAAGNDKGKSKSEPMNKTDTDFASLDVSCEKKTVSGEGWNFKIACWNVAGVKAWVKKRGLEYLKVEDPDIMCLQEVKCSEKTKPPEVKTIPNYPYTYWVFAEEANGHNGVATFCKVKPENVSYGFSVADDDSEEDKKFKRSFNKEGRLIVTEFEKFYLLNAYVPNGGRGTKDDKQGKPYPPRVTSGERQAWDRLFRDLIKSLDEKKPIVVTGDLNVAHEPIDLANPKTNASTAGFTKEEREGFTEMLKSTKLVDTYRSLYPEEKGYTFWSYIGNARQKNVGWRLDYFLLSEKLQESLCESLMRKDVYGSDHCPIVLYVHF